MEGTKAQYDEALDSLIVYREDRKNYASIKLGEIIVDLDKNYRISAVEIMNPDILFRIPKEKFSKISSASIQVQRRCTIFWIYLILEFEGIKEPQTLPVPLQLEHSVSLQ